MAAYDVTCCYDHTLEAQVYGELTGLAQAAIDGRDVSLIACGPPGAGMSFTLCPCQHSKVWLSPKDGGYTVSPQILSLSLVSVIFIHVFAH